MTVSKENAYNHVKQAELSSCLLDCSECKKVTVHRETRPDSQCFECEEHKQKKME